MTAPPATPGPSTPTNARGGRVKLALAAALLAAAAGVLAWQMGWLAPGPAALTPEQQRQLDETNAKVKQQIERGEAATGD